MSKKPASKLAAEANDFDVTPQPVKATRPILYVPQPKIEAPAPQSVTVPPEEMPAPTTHAQAAALVQTLQRELARLPGQTRAEQRARVALEIKLERAKQLAKELQQLAAAPDSATIGMHPCTCAPAPAAVDRMRRIISDRIR